MERMKLAVDKLEVETFAVPTNAAAADQGAKISICTSCPTSPDSPCTCFC